MNIEIKNLSKSFKKNNVLKNVSFSAESGQCIGILGCNGSGKSTLISILAGIQPYDKGEFLYDGKDLFKYKSQRSKLIGYVPQGTPLIEELTAYDNLLLWYDKKQLKDEIENGMLKILGIDSFLKVPVSKMSGGMKKRLSIACAISNHSPILLLDEPMAALDIICKQQISKYIKNHKKNGGIVILVTHDISELDLCDKYYIIKNGALTPFEYDGNVERLISNL